MTWKSKALGSGRLCTASAFKVDRFDRSAEETPTGVTNHPSLARKVSVKHRKTSSKRFVAGMLYLSETVGSRETGGNPARDGERSGSDGGASLRAMLAG